MFKAKKNRLRASYNCLKLNTKDILIRKKKKGTYTIKDIRELFVGINDISQKELESLKTVEQLWEFLERKEIITMNDVQVLKIIAKRFLKSEDLEKQIEDFELESTGAICRVVDAVASSARLVMKIGVPVAIGLAVLSYLGEEAQRRIIEKLILPSLVRLAGSYRNSVCFVVETTSLSSLKQLWMSYKDGSLKEKLKKAINEINEVRKLTNGTEIDLTVEIDEYEYREACWVLMLAEIDQAEYEQTSNKTALRRRHSLSCKQDLPTHDKSYASWEEGTILKKTQNKLMNETQKRKSAEKQVEQLKQEIARLKTIQQDTGKSAEHDKEAPEEENQELAVEPLKEVIEYNENNLKSVNDYDENSLKTALETDYKIGGDQHKDIPISQLKDNPVLLDQFSRCLDREFPRIKYWVHFAHVMEVNNDVISECQLRSEKSPTVKLFDYLKATRPQLTIKELISALSDIGRNDLCHMIRIFDDEDKVSEVITDSSSEMMDDIALELDSACRTTGNWRNLAQKLELTRNVYEKFKMYSDWNPTVSLVRYLYAASEEPIPLKRFVDVLKEMDRQDAVDEITKVTGSAENSIDAEELYANDILKLGSDLLGKVAELLNKDIPGIEGWQGLARHFRVDHSIIESLEGSQDMEVCSPTTRIINYLAANKPSPTITDIVRALEEIKRNDAMKILRSHFNIDVRYDRGNIEDLGITPDPHGLADNETYDNVNTTPFGIQATEQAKRADQKKKIHDDLPCLPKSAGPSVEEIPVESAVKRGDATSNQTDDLAACSSTREEVKKSWLAGVKEYFKQKLGLNSGETEASTQDGNNIDGYFQKYEKFALDYQDRVFLSDIKDIMRLELSIGAIIAVSAKNKCVGTCFRIGTRYVITNKHVTDVIKEHGISLCNCHVDFSYKEQGPADLRFRFATSPELVTSKELDYAILKLHPDDKREFPPSVLGSGYNIAPAGRKLQSEDCLTLIGHPERAKKQMNVSCPIKDQDDLRQHLTQAQSKLNETDFASHLFYIEKASSHPHVATYDVSTFFWGSSGSPGFLLKEKLLVVLHAGGIPFEGTAKKKHVLEYGILMSSLFEDVRRKISTGEIQDVPLSDIFDDSNAFTSSPESMDIDQVPGL